MRILTKDKTDSAEIAYNNHNDSDTNNGSRPSTSPLAPFSPLVLIETLSRKSFSYGKLPLEPIRLTVLKLDGSSFDITVAKNPTVAQLKQAVEDAFTHLPKHGIGKVSWSHVWAQFCLCFNGQKLLHDQDGIHGIKDGDQLQFVRHTSISYNLVKERSEKLSASKQDVRTQTQVQITEGEQEDSNQHNIAPVIITCQCSWGHLWKRLFSKKRHDTNMLSSLVHERVLCRDDP
ncbi:hypothetical protein L1987_80807 [Smallanthus sonchifolius]|uniref:Uncharacterized protein n=1 Tax=Smallanthus sonchifolius TaxID=185202 RepID=A0ACB8YPT4_9ASTR|nr:hypothetical protein L1987_80807 [Smallanthus sonchifolius]